MMASDSLLKRYFAKIIANLVSITVNIVSIMVVPKSLGPAAYGSYGFLSNFFTQLVTFLDMGASAGFYTKLSKNREDRGLIKFFIGLTLIYVPFIAALVGIAFLTGYGEVIWPDQKPLYIWMAAFWAFLSLYSQVINKIVDAFGFTVTGEKIRMVQAVVSMFLLVGLFFLGIINLFTYFIYQIAVILFLWAGWVALLGRQGVVLWRGIPLSKAEVLTHARSFWKFSHPIFVYVLISVLAELFDRWLLQKFAGSQQQGFFSFGFSLSSFCVIFAGAVTPLLTREYSIAHDEGDRGKLRFLFSRYALIVGAITSYFAIFISLHANFIAGFIVGNSFESAGAAASVMVLFAIGKSYAQTGGALFYATENTPLYRNIAIATYAIGIVITYFLIATPDYHGLGLGAFGLAVKTVVVNQVYVHIMFWYVSRLIGMNFWNIVKQEVHVIGVFALLAVGGTYCAGIIFKEAVPQFFFSGLLYTLFVVGYVFFNPGILSLSSDDFARLRKKIVARWS